MSDRALSLVPGLAGPDLVELRARVATAIAEDRDVDAVLDDLLRVLSDAVEDSAAVLVELDEHDRARIVVSTLPGSLPDLIHRAPRRRWFGSWAAVLTRRAELAVPDTLGSSLYREHRTLFETLGLLSGRAVPLTGRHGLLAGSLTWYIPEPRILTEPELDLLAEVTDLAQLAIRHQQSRAELLARVRNDPLTGLENRDGIEDHIRRALMISGARGGAVGVLFVDIDDLTLVNDSLGHTAGDMVIAEVADRIRTELLPGDVVVRFGGDEFIVVLERIDAVEEAQRFAQRLRTVLGEPMAVDDTELTITVCFGVTTGRPGASPLRLIDEGHAAVVRAKRGGRDRLAVHDAALDTGAGERLDREVRLREALENEEFVVRWQPKVDLAAGRAVGAEALVRWEHPELGLVTPDEFIGTAERAGLMHVLSDQVLRLAIEEASHFTDAIPEFAVAVNVSPTELMRADFIDVVASTLSDTGFDAKHLIIELTESVLANRTVVGRLHELRALGVRIAIDDFGTGYSSLAYVHELPIAMVKIDRAFLVGLEVDGTGAPVMRAAVAMAQALELHTTVEGVESSDQLTALRTLGVDWGQGYLFSEPVPAAELRSLLESSSTW